MTASTAPPLSGKLNIQLSLMMLLQYAIWGAWLPIFFPFLTIHRGFTGEQAGTLFAIGAIGAIFAPFISGQIADRYFNTEKFLGLSHIIGSVLVWQLSTVTSYTGFIVAGILYSLVYAPTLSLTNSLAFHHLPDRDRDFGKVRVWGTIGWIVVGIGIGQYLYHTHTPDRDDAAKPAAARIEAMSAEDKAKAIDELTKDKPGLSAEEKDTLLLSTLTSRVINETQVEGMSIAFKASAVLGIILGVLCFTLPKTPPKKGQKKFAPLQAMGSIKKMPLLALFLISFPVSCVHQFYFVRTAGFLGTLQSEASSAIDEFFAMIFGVGGGGLMTVGQIFEIVVLAFMPILAKAMSRKTLLLVGVLAYIVRFAVFAYMPYTWAVVPALALHGVCFGAFFFVAFMIVDEESGPDVRASAQGLYNLVIIALGVIAGNFFAGQVDKIATMEAGGTDFQTLFSVPMWVVVGCFVLLMAWYPGRKKAQSGAGESASA